MDIIKQTDKPIYADILWSRPVTRAKAGRLLIIGGHTQNFSNVENAYQLALAAGIGECKVVLPEGLKPMLKGLEDCVFLPQTPSGSLAANSYEEIKAMAEDSDGTLLAGDTGSNEETKSLLERFVANTSGPITAAEDVMEQLAYEPSLLSQRADTLLSLNYDVLRNWTSGLKLPIAFTSQLNWRDFAENLGQLASEHSKASWLITRDESQFLACDGRVSVTNVGKKADQITTAVLASVFWLQNPNKPFEAITTAMYVVNEANNASGQNIISETKKLLSEYE